MPIINDSMAVSDVRYFELSSQPKETSGYRQLMDDISNLSVFMKKPALNHDWLLQNTSNSYHSQVSKLNEYNCGTASLRESLDLWVTFYIYPSPQVSFFLLKVRFTFINYSDNNSRRKSVRNVRTGVDF